MIAKRLPYAWLCSLVLAAACGPPGGDAATTGIGSPGLPPAELTEVVFEGFNGAVLSTQVLARRAEIDLAAGIAELTDVRITFREEVRGVVELRAARGEVRIESEDFVLGGGVTGSTEAGDRFETEELRYASAERRIWSDTQVRLVRSNLILRADGMEIEIDQPERRIRLLGHVRGEMEPS